MAYTFSPSISCPSPYEVEVTREEFHSFHKIDRDFFTRLVVDLKQDMNKSSQVIAFLLLVEQLGFARNLIACLVPLDDRSINAVVNEVVECLSILCNQDYYTRHVRHNHNNNDEVVIPLLKKITDSYLTLRYINENRETLLAGVTKNLSDVCIRAFDDINEKQQLELERENFIEEMKRLRLGSPQQTRTRFSVQHQTPIWWNAQQQIPIRPSLQQGTLIRSSVRQGTPVRVSAPKVRAPAPALKKEAKAAGMETERAEAEEEVTPADDRTVFLTFSKGYPISESEVRVYFTRKFGEVIETIVMDEGKENKQPLFARMVLKMQYASKIKEIVTPINKKKFTIDGKHVWARKYVR
ncbi:unnamed protein product [Eruca vesicaria subsp. sativa]|uniref:Uncharacterized protein n=1 Tax=Eruca vesicaria subsp. sativa TaxID=29727 RepID=A0ABC8JSE6_ERUVS|nr:unnamed protein product [Eruca vesicaria subsp. sativa]